MELAIDTSTRYASVGLSRRGELVIQLAWRSEQNHSVELVPAIREVMARARAEMGDMEAIAVARGPGGFSALRVGMSTAKALAVALGIPIVSVETLDIEAQPYLGLGAPVCALIDAGRNRFYVGKYAATAASPDPQPEVMSYDELVDSIATPTLFCGEGVWAVSDVLRERLGSKALLASAPPPTRSASTLGYLGYLRWQAGVTDDPATLQPLYLRSAQIEVASKAAAKT